jgi:RNA polymerase subunit RPABC4/transcription elongation factor Spt4
MCGCMTHATMNHQQSAEHHPAAVPVKDVKPVSTGLFCAHCNYPLQSDYAYCPGYGMQVGLATCQACGQKVKPEWTSCAYCGSPLVTGN